ncbi:amidohydrolase family protein [Mycoplasmopsis felis]|uniref:N-acetylglucosamine-6-phosphate deacetylase n=1 Tax=Mycoplasmopsis felis TaxID=33923 RepID=UPI002AF6C281|nr:amidohydrolase family protein [Mycoplasmopsis felis]WQQ01487.1 amidohydrolase family protein [Mycoplasmopsis felis]
MNIIKNVKIINYNEIIECADIYIQDDKITQIIRNNNKANAIAVPGFIDTHIHGFKGYDVMEGTKAVKNISKYLAKHGTTSFMPTAMTNNWKVILKSLREIANNEVWVSKNLGIHIEGPFIGLSKKGAHKPEYLQRSNAQKINTLYSASLKQLKKISFDPLMVNIQTFKYLQNKLNIIGSIGHTNASLKVCDKFFENGCFSVCHLWNAMSGIDSRNPGLLQSSFLNNNSYAELIIDLLHVSKESLELTFLNKGYDKIIAISDAIKPAYTKNGDSISGDIPVTKNKLRIVLKGTNTIAGSGITIHDAFKNLIKIGVSMQNAVKLTSYNSAKYLKLENEIGVISPNYFADIVLLDTKNLKIKNVYINGNLIR